MNQFNPSWKGNRSNDTRRHRPIEVGKGLGSLSALREIAQPVREPQPQPEPLKFEGPLNAWYSTKRNGREMKVFLIEIRKDVAVYKDKETDKHSQSMSLAKFMKFYKQA